MKKILFFTLMGITIYSIGYAQEKPVNDTILNKLINLNEVIFSANKSEEKKSDVAYNIEVIKSKDIELSNPQNSADMLSNTGNIMVQKSQGGGGSPIIRGFEANRVLIVIDGVRMNNAIYRGGHLQDVITIDNAMLDRTEIIYGPSSVMYGSDALGGVMHFYTKNPLFGINKMNFKLNSSVRYSSANQEKTGHLDFNIGYKRLASLTSITYSDFDDMRTGYARNPNPSFGRCEYYAGVNAAGTADSMIRNSNTNIQKRSGYSQIDFMEKLLFKANDNLRIGLNVQYSTSSEINRYDRLSEYSGGNLKFAENGYGPQERLLTSLYVTLKSDSKLFDNMRITAAYQDISQERFSRRFSTDYTSGSGSNFKTRNFEKVNVYSLNADLRKQVKEKHELSYGAEVVANKVTSTASKANIYTGAEAIGPVDTRYPNGGSKTANVGLYLTHSWEINEKFILSEGIRYSYNSITCNFDTSSAVSNFQFPFTSVNQTNNALNGNIALIMMPEKNVRFSILASTGFRTPNVEDISKVFESVGSRVVVPNETLKPEYAYNIEGGLSTTIMDNKIKLEANYHYTLLKNAIVLKEYQYNGKDSVMFNGVLSQVVAPQNVDEAYIQGLFAAITADFTDNVSFKTSLTYTMGQYHKQLPAIANDPNHDTIVPMDHIPPMFGQTSILYHFKKFESEIYARYSAAKTGKEYSLGTEDNELYSADPINGYMPGWVTFNIKTAYHVTKNVSINLGVENLFDVHYRMFASGFSSPGRNIVGAIRIKI
ncbi:MAG: TonB-dependent receptor [Bacteroidetes bacterium]|nr:TonB-dependent receptor [Bacteroidota bacterium]